MAPIPLLASRLSAAMGAAAAPFDVPFSEWPQSTAARTWLLTTLLPRAGPPLVAALLFPAALCVSWACVKRGKVPRGVGRACASGSSVVLGTVLALVLYTLLALLGTAISLQGVALNATAQAADLTCGPAHSGSPLTCAASAHSSCRAASLIGFADGLADGTTHAAAAALAFVSNLSAAADELVPVELASAAAASVAGEMARNVSELNESVVAVQIAVAAAHAIGAPYFPNSPTLWAPLEASTAHSIPPMPHGSVARVGALAAGLSAQHSSLTTLVIAAVDAAHTRTAGVVTAVSLTNATVVAEAAALRDTFDSAREQVASVCQRMEDTWSAAGLPLADETSALPPHVNVIRVPSSVWRVQSPALELMVATGALLLAPFALLLCATCATSKGYVRVVGAPAATLVALSLPLLLLLAAIALGVAPLLAAACEPASVDAALHSNLAPLGNISLPAPSLSLVGSPFATDTSSPASISIASAVPRLLSCGVAPHASNLVSLLHLHNLVDFTKPLEASTRALGTELQAFNSSAAATIDAALASLPNASSELTTTSNFVPTGLPAAMSLLRNMTQVMRFQILPAATPPGTAVSPERIEWTLRFAAMYGTPALGPDEQMIALNAKLHQTLAAAHNLSLPIDALSDACNETVGRAPATIAAAGHALHRARAVVGETWQSGASLSASLSDVVYDGSRAEKASPCAWVSSCYQQARGLTCDAGVAQLEALGSLLACAALVGFFSLCVLSCTRSHHAAVALSQRSRNMPATPTRRTSAGGRGGITGAFEDPLLSPSSRADRASNFERESPFATYTPQRRASRPSVPNGGEPRAYDNPSECSSRESMSAPPSERREAPGRAGDTPSRRLARDLFGRSRADESAGGWGGEEAAGSADYHSAPLPLVGWPALSERAGTSASLSGVPPAGLQPGGAEPLLSHGPRASCRSSAGSASGARSSPVRRRGSSAVGRFVSRRLGFASERQRARPPA